MSLINILLGLLFFALGLILIFISTKRKNRQIYICRTIAYALFLTSLYLMIMKYINIKGVIDSLETLTTISATIAGFVFSGISIVFALLDVEYINSLFKNDFLDKVFYRAYSVVALSLVDITIYVLINQFSLILFDEIIMFYLYIFWMSILFYMLMIFDFIKVIKRAKK